MPDDFDRTSGDADEATDDDPEDDNQIELTDAEAAEIAERLEAQPPAVESGEAGAPGAAVDHPDPPPAPSSRRRRKPTSGATVRPQHSPNDDVEHAGVDGPPRTEAEEEDAPELDLLDRQAKLFASLPLAEVPPDEPTDQDAFQIIEKISPGDLTTLLERIMARRLPLRFVHERQRESFQRKLSEYIEDYGQIKGRPAGPA
jgi:hypothetical protein